MPTYKTEYVKNLSTGEPFTFEVPERELERLENQKKLIAAGQAPMLGDIKDLIEIYEFSFFPAYKELLKIWFENEFTTELITQILSNFGATESFIQRLLEDEEYISEVKPWFEGITCDGERASRAMKMVYEQTKSYYSLCSNPSSRFWRSL